MDIFSPWADPFVFPFPAISQWKLGLEDSENVCRDCRWCCCVDINHKCKCRWGWVFFFFKSSPSPSLFRPPPLFLFRVFLTFPTLVVPVHSIRLEYGCVVVDTCSVWSVSWCRRFVWLVAPRDAIEHGAVTGSVETRDEKGWPRFPKKKNIGSHFMPDSWEKHFWNSPTLHSAALGSLSGYENPWTGLFSLLI